VKTTNFSTAVPVVRKVQGVVVVAQVEGMRNTPSDLPHVATRPLLEEVALAAVAILLPSLRLKRTIFRSREFSLSAGVKK
jgi:hypothetical protein